MNDDMTSFECKRFAGLLDKYMDGELSEGEKEFLNAHQEKCGKCAQELRIAEDMMETLKTIDDDIIVPLPAQKAWRSAVRKEIAKKKAHRGIRSLATLAACAVVMVAVTFGLRGSGSLPGRYPESDAASAMGAYTESFDAAAPMVRAVPASEEIIIESDGSETDASVVFSEEEEQIRSALYTAESADFDNDVTRLIELTEEYEGYVQQESVMAAEAGRVTNIVCRVPAELFEEYVTALVNIGKTVSLDKYSEDASLYYYDIEARLETKRDTAERLNQLIAEATGEELISLNQQLEEIYREIDALTSQAGAKENDLTYAKVTVTMKELAIATASEERSLSDRSASGFRQSMNALKDFFEDMVVSLAVIAPVLILAVCGLILVLVIIYIVKRVNRNRKGEKHE